MKKKNLVLFALLLVTLFLGCASGGPVKTARTIEEAFPDRMEKTVIGMSINDFKAVWPEAKKTSATENNETYEFVFQRLTFGNETDKIYTYFYFTNNVLIKYESKH